MRLLIAILISVTAFADSQNPAVSPDGSKIAFTSDRDGTTDLYVMSADGTHVERLTNNAERESAPAWSTDGKTIRFFTTGVDSSRFHALDVKSRAVTQIGQVPGRGVRITADGKRVLYALGSWTNVQLMESDPNGANARQLSDGSGVVWGPRWSPDGKQLAYTGQDASGQTHIYLMKLDGSDVRQLTHFDVANGRAQSPAWSPDGKRIAVQADTKEQAHLWIVDAASGEAKKLAAHDEKYIDEQPAWFPDGKRLAFASTRSGKLEVWTMNADGSALKQLTTSPSPR
ncbi:MAG TPA: LpqB family beta-propeller domain-containing protein [Thermoanaerobaculia bacterium]|nr:LpqB family beta-propeller domain-containing protein [Thermoanaerobaculia bacterium]